MKRGDIWTVAGGKDYAGKPRPVVVLQDDHFSQTESITVCAFTTDKTEAPLIRLLVAANANNGLRSPCSLMVYKITTVSKSKLGARVGRLDDETLLRALSGVRVNVFPLTLEELFVDWFRDPEPVGGPVQHSTIDSGQPGFPA